MTDARFFSNNSVTSEVNHVTFMQGSWAYKSPNNFFKCSKGSPLRGDSLSKVEIFARPRAEIENGYK